MLFLLEISEVIHPYYELAVKSFGIFRNLFNVILRTGCAESIGNALPLSLSSQFSFLCPLMTVT